MASLLPGFEYDIFISYRHNDNKSGRVTEFVKALQEELEATIKEPVSVYFDSNPRDGLLETHNVDKSLEGKLKCLIFIPILSQTYCDPKSFAWQHEFCAFNKLSKEDPFGRDIKLSNGNVASRILPIRVHELDAEDKALIENEIGGVLRPIDFIYKEKGVNRHLKVTDKKEDNLNHTDYSNQLNKVANAIKEIIYAFKNPTTKVDTLGSTTNQQATTRSSSKKKYSFTVLLFLVLLAGYFYFIGITKKSGTAIDKSIAVLPFVDLSQNKDQEYFSDGLSEELLSLLAKIPELKVIGRTSSFAFKGTNEDLRTIAEKLGVAHILEGSVRKSGNTLRITVQLIKAADGAHLWSETYNRTLDDIFKVQDEIAGAVVGQLKLKLLQDAMPAPKAMKPEAYNLYLEAKFFFGMRSKESYLKALAKLQQALTIEPDAAPVWALLSEVYSSQADSGQRSVEEGYRLAREAGEKALQLDVGYAEAYASLGQVYESFDWDFVKADNAFKKALELDPANVSAMNGAAILAQDLGRLDESIELKKKCIGADPLRAGSYNSISITYYYKGDWIEAEYAVRKALELVPYFGNGYYGLSKIQLAAGKYESALYSVMQERDEFWKACGLPLVYFSQDRKSKSNEALQKTIEKFANEGAIQIAEVYAWRNEKDKAFEWLERAFTQHDPGLAAMLPDPLLKNLHTDARWLPFLTKMKLVVYWGAYKEKYLK